MDRQESETETNRATDTLTDRHTDRQTDKNQNLFFFTPERGKPITLYASLTDRNSALLPFVFPRLSVLPHFLESSCQTQLSLPNSRLVKPNCVCQSSCQSKLCFPNSRIVKPVFAKQSYCQTNLCQTVVLSNQKVFARQSACQISLLPNSCLVKPVFAKQSTFQTKLYSPNSRLVKPNCVCQRVLPSNQTVFA